LQTVIVPQPVRNGEWRKERQERKTGKKEKRIIEGRGKYRKKMKECKR
jgi:hypothetical protein